MVPRVPQLCDLYLVGGHNLLYSYWLIWSHVFPSCVICTRWASKKALFLLVDMFPRVPQLRDLYQVGGHNLLYSYWLAWSHVFPNCEIYTRLAVMICSVPIG